jgi:hypothetical protein
MKTGQGKPMGCYVVVRHFKCRHRMLPTHFFRFATSSSNLVTQLWIFTLVIDARVSVSGLMDAAVAIGRASEVRRACRNSEQKYL